VGVETRKELKRNAQDIAKRSRSKYDGQRRLKRIFSLDVNEPKKVHYESCKLAVAVTHPTAVESGDLFSSADNLGFVDALAEVLLLQDCCVAAAPPTTF
jgi:hypothetical protein